MKRLLAVAVMVVGTLAFAQAAGGAATPPAQQGSAAEKGEAMGGWTPSKVTKEDKKGIDAMWKQFGEAMMKKDMDKAADLVDFPVLMVTDDAKGNVVAETWDRATWIANMKKSMESMPAPKGNKMPPHHMSYDFVTNGIAVSETTTSMSMGKKHMNVKSSSLVVNKDGKWMIKSMVEGGWGGTMGQTGMGGSGK